MSDRNALPVWLKVTHGFGSIAYGVKENGFGTFLLLFYNQVVGLEAWRVSLALMIAMFVDALVDPMVGHFSDRTYTRWGKRLPWLYVAAIPLGLAWMLLWVRTARAWRRRVSISYLCGDIGAGAGFRLRSSIGSADP